MEGHFTLDLVDGDCENHEIEIEYEVVDRGDADPEVTLRLAGRIPHQLGLTRGEILSLAEGFFWKHDLLTEIEDDDEQPYFG